MRLADVHPMVTKVRNGLPPYVPKGFIMQILHRNSGDVLVSGIVKPIPTATQQPTSITSLLCLGTLESIKRSV